MQLYSALRQCPVYKKLPPPPDCGDPSENSGRRRTRVNVAGVTCHAWSSEGANQGAAHESEMPLSVWLAERRFMFERGEEDVCFLECTPRFPAQDRLEQVLGDVAHVLSLIDGPEWHGWPHRRNRILAAAISKSTTAWLGPADLRGFRQDYSSRFHRQMVAPGTMLLTSSDADRIEEMVALAVCRKNNVTSRQMTKVYHGLDLGELASLILPPGGVSRLKEWQALYEDKLMENPAIRAFLCDVDHNLAGKGPALWVCIAVCKF